MNSRVEDKYLRDAGLPVIINKRQLSSEWPPPTKCFCVCDVCVWRV
jgi:hypothetical protein